MKIRTNRMHDATSGDVRWSTHTHKSLPAAERAAKDHKRKTGSPALVIVDGSIAKVVS